jgi:hypothetical protein
MSNKAKSFALTALFGAISGAVYALAHGTALEPYAPAISSALVGFAAGAFHVSKPGDVPASK